MTTFSELGLNPTLLEALASEGYTSPTPIQAQAIPGVLAGRDLLGIAQTGTGKTAAFALPILHRLAADRKRTERGRARALILSPTRELASQIAESFRVYGRGLGLSIGTIFGGVAHRPQIDLMRRGIDVLVATPGRLLDLMGEGHVSLDGTEILVLDEADQMLDLGFIRPLRQIIARLPRERQGLFFSATMPHEIGALAAELLRDPLRVAVTPVAKTADRVDQRVIHVETPRKRALLVELFGDPNLSRTIVFTRTKRGADKVARHLDQNGIKVASIHGNKSQNQRERALGDFKTGRIRGLVATEIAARGIDIDDVSHVINYEMPNIPESYVHRIGRTARAGSEGIAISLVDGEENAYLRDIERLIKQKIPAQDRRNCPELAKAAQAQASAEPVANGRADDERDAFPRRESRGGHQRQDRDRGDRGDRARDHRRPRQGETGRGPRPERDRAEPRFERPREPRASFDGERADTRRSDRQTRGHGEERRPRRDDRQHGERPQGDFAPRGERREEGRRQDGWRSDARRNNDSRGSDSRRPEGSRPAGPRGEGRRYEGSRQDGGRPGGDRRDGPRQERRRDDSRGEGRRNAGSAHAGSGSANGEIGSVRFLQGGNGRGEGAAARSKPHHGGRDRDDARRDNRGPRPGRDDRGGMGFRRRGGEADGHGGSRHGGAPQRRPH